SWGGKWDGIYKVARPYLLLENNLIDVDPLIVDKETGDFRLRKDSPAFDIGFEAIPFNEIGLYDDPKRASWPVVNEVR
ncbi:MAG: hypothetical protein VCC01_08295, partial [Candidatus Hydrogenedentota bacterium]